MKIIRNETDDVLVLMFSDNKFKECVTLTHDIIAEIDVDNKIRALEILNYSRFKIWVSDLLKENNLSTLTEDDIMFFMHQGYMIAWFNKNDVNLIDKDVPCKYYLEGETILEDKTVKQYLQEEVDNYLLLYEKLKGYDKK